MKTEKHALVCGSFDPVTLGHVNLIQRVSKMFSLVTVGIFENVDKIYLFSRDDRHKLLSDSLSFLPNVTVKLCYGFVADYVKDNEIDVIVKGVRNEEDFIYEFNMAKINKKINPNAETLLLPTHNDFADISSSKVKQLASEKQFDDLEKYVPTSVLEALVKKYK